MIAKYLVLVHGSKKDYCFGPFDTEVAATKWATAACANSKIWVVLPLFVPFR